MLGKKREGFSGKIAIVTGGASGIGRALALELARRGAQVVVADRHADGARDTARTIEHTGGAAWAEELDVRDAAAFRGVVERTVARSGRVDALFNNAGIGVGGEVDGYSQADWDDVLDVNLRGVTNGIQAVYARMVRQRAGTIVNTASVLGLLAMPGQASYTAAKHAVVGLSRALRVEAKTHGIRVAVLCPGAVWTPILGGGRYGRSGYESMRDDVVQKLWASARPITADELARRALDGVERDEAVVVVPSFWKALWLADRLAPTVMRGVYGLVLANVRKEIAAAGLVRSRA